MKVKFKYFSGVSQRNAALQLSALLCHLFGVEWVVSTEEDDKRFGLNTIPMLLSKCMLLSELPVDREHSLSY